MKFVLTISTEKWILTVNSDTFPAFTHTVFYLFTYPGMWIFVSACNKLGNYYITVKVLEKRASYAVERHHKGHSTSQTTTVNYYFDLTQLINILMFCEKRSYQKFSFPLLKRSAVHLFARYT